VPLVIGNIAAPTADAGPNITIALGSNAILSGSGGGVYSWIPSTGLSCSNCPNPIASPIITTTYVLVVMDIYGCSDTDIVIVRVNEPPCNGTLSVFIPNAFSPNGDGENDVLQLYIINNTCAKEIQFVIYDRWGERVFETNDANIKWDGTYKGQQLNSGVYMYLLTGVLENKDAFLKKGNISLIH